MLWKKLIRVFKVFPIRSGIANVMWYLSPESDVKRFLGEIFHALAWQNECQIREGHLMADHAHMCIAIPSRYPVASVIGFLKGKSAIAVARQVCGKERNSTGEHLWARGYAVSTVGFELEQFHQYIRAQ
jgi:putative transposase